VSYAETEHTLPNGLKFITRDGTSDYNSANACSQEDEYHLRDLDLDGKTCFDIGAHIGGVTMLMALKGARVIAVEPVPDNADLIRRNALLNGFEFIHVVEKAAGAPGGIELAYGWHGDENADVHTWIGNTGLGLDGYPAHHITTVETVTLQELVDEYGLPYAVKIDCEGGEWDLLAEPIAAEVEVWSGEHHPLQPGASKEYLKGRAEISELLGATHVVSFTGPADGSAGAFLATKL